MNIETSGDDYKVTLVYDSSKGLPLWNMLVELEIAIIRNALDTFGGSKAKAADHLKLNRTTLVEKAKKYGFPCKVKKVYNESGPTDGADSLG